MCACVKSRQGFSLLEVMIASAIASMMLLATLYVRLQVDRSNRVLYDRTVCYRTAHQAMEVLLAEDIDSMILQHGNTFVATETHFSGPQTGSISVTDLGWNGADKAYLIELEIPTYGVVLRAVRTRT